MPALEVGRFNILTVTGKNAGGWLLSDGREQVFLPMREAPEGTRVGQTLRVFVYVDTGQNLLATTSEALAQVGDFACLECVQVTEHGAFLDWGVPKDLFVPFAEQHRRMVEGRAYVVAVCLDKHVRRPMASSKLGPFFDYDLSQVALGSEQSLLVFDRNDAGVKVVVGERYLGLVYTDATFRPLPIGTRLTGYVERLRADNRIDISLTPIDAGGRAALRDQAQETIVLALQRAGGFLPIHDKSSPAEILHILGLTKKVFKRSAGALYKARRIRIAEDGIHLL